MILDLLPGVLWSGFLGLVIGNFATNPLYRLPRNEPLFARDPYCGDCSTTLTARDLFPLFSWLFSRGKCRYCGAHVPAAYALFEGASGCIYILLYLQYGFREPFVLASFGMIALQLLAGMMWLDQYFCERSFAFAMVLGILFRTQMEGTFYGTAGTIFAALLFAGLWWKHSGLPLRRDYAAFPVPAKIALLAGAWLHFPALLVSLGLLWAESRKGQLPRLAPLVIEALVLLTPLLSSQP